MIVWLCALAFHLTSAAPVRQDPAPVHPREAAVLPDAGFVARIDVSAVLDSAFVQNLLPREETEAVSRVRAATGLGPEDVLDVLLSARSGEIELQTSGQKRRLTRVPGVLAVSLREPIGRGQLAKALVSIWSGREVVGQEEAVGNDLLELAHLGGDEPSLFAGLSRTGATVFLASERAELEATLDRERTGRPHSLSPQLARVEGSLAPDHQVHVVLLAPPALGQWMSPPETTGRAATLVERVLEPFRGIESLALAAAFADEARLQLLGDLGSAERARDAEGLLSAFVLPNLRRILARRFGGGAIWEEAFSVRSSGPETRISLRVTAEDVRGLLQDGAPND